MEKTKNNNVNRRAAFRIMEQADVFYHKIDIDQGQEEGSSNFNNLIAVNLSQNTDSFSTEAAIDSRFPSSSTQESDTLNVNISVSGISFTCEQDFRAGDYLMLRVLLLSSMTVIMTCCKIVYTKRSNPFEKNQYPYLIGVQFVNLKADDKALLNQYINKKRTRSVIANSFLASIIITILMLPDMAFELLLGLFSFLMDEFIEVAHLSYEFIEYSLDYLIEVSFHTGLQETQVIVFYIQIALLLGILYPLTRGIIMTIKKIFNHCGSFYCRKKASVFYYWGEQSLWYKIGFISTGVFVSTCYLLLFI